MTSKILWSVAASIVATLTFMTGELGAQTNVVPFDSLSISGSMEVPGPGESVGSLEIEANFVPGGPVFPESEEITLHLLAPASPFLSTSVCTVVELPAGCFMRVGEQLLVIDPAACGARIFHVRRDQVPRNPPPTPRPPSQPLPPPLPGNPLPPNPFPSPLCHSGPDTQVLFDLTAFVSEFEASLEEPEHAMGDWELDLELEFAGLGPALYPDSPAAIDLAVGAQAATVRLASEVEFEGVTPPAVP